MYYIIIKGIQSHVAFNAHSSTISFSSNVVWACETCAFKGLFSYSKNLKVSKPVVQPENDSNYDRLFAVKIYFYFLKSLGTLRSSLWDLVSPFNQCAECCLTWFLKDHVLLSLLLCVSFITIGCFFTETFVVSNSSLFSIHNCLSIPINWM